MHAGMTALIVMTVIALLFGEHLERLFAKLGVETRTAAAAMAMNRMRLLHPQFEG